MSDTTAETEAIFIAGQMIGLASRLDVKSLKRVLDREDPEFRYAKECRDAIEFVIALSR